jgi:hypothetical protein
MSQLVLRYITGERARLRCGAFCRAVRRSFACERAEKAGGREPAAAQSIHTRRHTPWRAEATRRERWGGRGGRRTLDALVSSGRAIAFAAATRRTIAKSLCPQYPEL